MEELIGVTERHGERGQALAGQVDEEAVGFMNNFHGLMLLQLPATGAAAAGAVPTLVALRHLDDEALIAGLYARMLQLPPAPP